MSDKIGYRIFGASHAEAVGVVLEGIGFGERIDLDRLQAFVDRRKAVSASYSTSRAEPDEIVIESGISDGVTTGREIVAKIYNKDVRRGDYDYKYRPRPSHADYAAYMKYGEDYDASGGNKFSGRMTAPLCIAGGIVLQLLERKGVKIAAYIQRIGQVEGASYRGRNVDKSAVLALRETPFPLLDRTFHAAMMREIEGAASVGDTTGGVVECCIFGMKPGIGDAFTDGLESRIASSVFGIPAVKGVEFGSGFALSGMRGSGANDEFSFEKGHIITTTNHNGGINGGISNGMPITFRTAFKPAPSVSRTQNTVNLKTGENDTVTVRGRHDACIVPRAVPAVEAAAALAIAGCVLD